MDAVGEILCPSQPFLFDAFAPSRLLDAISQAAAQCLSG
jgi:hypothetical protein